jgi:hypothetical protein
MVCAQCGKITSNTKRNGRYCSKKCRYASAPAVRSPRLGRAGGVEGSADAQHQFPEKPATDKTVSSSLKLESTCARAYSVVAIEDDDEPLNAVADRILLRNIV